MKYTIGIDYGTQSARAVLARVEDGQIVAEAEAAYEHGVMQDKLPGGAPLGADWALQDAADYYDMLKGCVKDLIQQSGIDPAQVIGICIDTTSCTILPLTQDMKPLSGVPEFCNEPHAYVKLWKHHAAQPQANRLNEIAREYDNNLLSRYGGIISSEWMFPKIMQVADEAPHVYKAAACFAEVADWLNARLTGKLVKNNVMAGYKAMWNRGSGYPDTQFFKMLNPLMENVISEKLPARIMDIGEAVGFLTQSAANDLGLTTGAVVAVAHSDACAVAAGLGLNTAGQMVMSIGTSTCHLLLGDGVKDVPGICGAVENGTLPGFISYEAGQAAVGDIFGWFAHNCVSARLEQEAEEAGKRVFQLLDEKAEKLKPGQSGLVALDWFNGNRTVLVNADLSGLIMGLTLETKPEEIFLALMEATAFGTRKIIKTFEKNGVPVNEIFVCGGIPQKSPLLMQIYADVCNREIHTSSLKQASAYSCAIFAAAAAGADNGGYDTVIGAAEKMAWRGTKTYVPNPKNVTAYDRLFDIFEELHDFAGIKSDAMLKLKAMRIKNCN